MFRPLWLGRAAVAALLGSLLVLLAPAPGGADPSTLRHSADALQAQNEALAQESHSALLELYSLDSQLTSAHAKVDTLRARIADLQRERASARHQLRVVRKVVRVSQRNLERRLIALYEEGEPNPLAILLGAETLNDALTNLASVDAVATQDRSMLEQARRARSELRTLTRSLARRALRAEALESEAQAAADALDAARSERLGYIGQLASQRSLNEREISSLESRAQAAEERARTVSAQETIAPVPVATTPVSTPPPDEPAPTTGRTLTVVSTAYALRGSTATGIPAGPGVVAVDPTVIPLGTHMTIPGYGEGVAADTGGAIKGARIDVWVPTEAQAQAWGVRTVTISLHG